MPPRPSAGWCLWLFRSPPPCPRLGTAPGTTCRPRTSRSGRSQLQTTVTPCHWPIHYPITEHLITAADAAETLGARLYSCTPLQQWADGPRLYSTSGAAAALADTSVWCVTLVLEDTLQRWKIANSNLVPCVYLYSANSMYRPMLGDSLCCFFVLSFSKSSPFHEITCISAWPKVEYSLATC